MDSTEQILIAIVAIALAIGVRVVADRLDRSRIREHVESAGGTVLDISWNPFGPGWLGSRERIYDVTCKTSRGATITATCKTSMFSGVYWTGNAPPEEFGAQPETPPEPISCSSCGTKIPAHQASCPHCGWSYQSR
jgi:hypothetical protein